MKEQKCVEISLTLRGESEQVDVTVEKLKEVVRKCGIEMHWEKETHWKMDYSNEKV